MKKIKLPGTDSIRKLADFWDHHDLTDFDEQLQDVAAPAFARGRARRAGAAIHVPLKPREAQAVEQMARARHVSREELVRTWVLQKIAARGGNGRARGGSKRP
jgi:hypothetical protein